MGKKKFMKNLEKKRLRKRLTSAILLISTIVSISGILGAIAMVVVGSRYEHAMTNYGFSQGDIGKMMIVFTDTRSNLRAVVGYEDKDLVQKCYDAYYEKKESCGTYMAAVRETLTTKEEREIFSEVESLVDQYWTEADAVVELGKTLDSDKRLEAQTRATEKVSPLYDQVYSDMVTLMDTNVKQGDALEKTLRLLELIMILVIAVIIAAALVLARMLGGDVADSIVTPLEQLGERFKKFAQGDLSSEFPQLSTQDEISDIVAVSKEMADDLSAIIKDVDYRMEQMAEGDYTVVSTVPERYQGEFAGMNNAIHKMNEEMNQTLRHIEEAAAQVSAGASNLAEGSQNLAEGATNQAGAIEELLASFTNITEGVEHTHDSMKETYDVAMKYVEEANKSQKQMQLMTESMNKLSDMSQQIETIIGDIEKIAQQTNLLSLNASIEAARAGEAGRGFAVVASQIGKLADESAQSAVNTRELIMQCIEEVENGNRTVESTSKTITELVEGINIIANRSNELETLSENQAEQMSQAEQGVNQISEVVQSNAAIAEESSATSEELSAESTTLQDLVQRFKLREE